MTTAAAAQILGVTTRTVARWIEEGRLKSEKVGRAHHVDLEEARQVFADIRAGSGHPLFPCAACETPAPVNADSLCDDCATLTMPAKRRYAPCFHCAEGERLAGHVVCAACHAEPKCPKCHPGLAVHHFAEHVASGLRLTHLGRESLT